jgi:hypothetical protein
MTTNGQARKHLQFIDLTILSSMIATLLCSCSSNLSPVVDPNQAAGVENQQHVETAAEKIKREEEEKEKDKHRIAESATEQLMTKHSAISYRTWRQQFSRSGNTRFSLQLQDAIAARKGEPVVLVAGVVDLFRKGSRKYLRCEDAYGTNVLLVCDDSVVKIILDSPIDDDGIGAGEAYAIVARLRGVSLTYEQNRTAKINDIPFNELDLTPLTDGTVEIGGTEEVTDTVKADAYIDEGAWYPKLIILGECVDAVRLVGVDREDVPQFSEEFPKKIAK